MNIVIICIILAAIIITVYFSFIGHQKSFGTIQKLHIERIDHDRNDFFYIFDENHTKAFDEKLSYSGITWGEFLDLSVYNVSSKNAINFAKIDGLIKCPSIAMDMVSTANSSSSSCLQVS
jgi:hypothetical protein